MAAILCLIFLPVFFAALVMIGSMSSLSVGTLLGGATFLLLAGGLVVGGLRLATSWENE